MTAETNRILHDGRTAELRALDVTDKVVVSIGAAGRWYFDWLHSACGAPDQHIGVEYYSTKPDDLPENVIWVANTAGSMPDVATGCADVVFSGQNLEHLWKDEVAGFVCEAHRILKPGGLLVMDSPNRLITELYREAHPEHMVELTPDEASDLVRAAGFDVEVMRGIFLCRDPETGALLPKGDASDAPPWTLAKRSDSAGDAPNDSYIWWLRARRTDRPADRKAVQAVIDRYWSRGWAERLTRFGQNIGTSAQENGKDIVMSDVGDVGALLFGPFAPLPAGRFRATAYVRLLASDVAPRANIGFVDVMVQAEQPVLGHVTLTGDMLGTSAYSPISIDFDIPETTFGFQIRICPTGVAGIAAERRLELESFPVSGNGKMSSAAALRAGSVANVQSVSLIDRFRRMFYRT